MTFRGRLITAATLVTLLTLGIALGAIYLSVNDSQQDQLDAALVHEAREEAQESASQGGDELVISQRPGPMANDVGPLTKYAVIYGPDGRVIAATPSFAGDVPPATTWRHRLEEPFNAWVGKEHLRAVRVAVPHHPGTILVLGAPRADLDGDATFLARAMLLVLGTAVVWTITLGTWLIHRLTRDHDRIIAVARLVAAGDLSARVGRRGPDREIAQLGHDIDEMIERLSLLVASQQRFIAHAAHELRSPLTTLYGELSLALRKDREAEAYRKAIVEALASTKQLKDLAEDLLALARLGAGPAEVPAHVSLLALAHEAASASAWVATPRQVVIQVSGQEAMVAGQPRDLLRLLRNLLENAARHATPSGRVTVEVQHDGSYATVTVMDDGVGVQPQDRERLFEPFFRGNEDRAGGEGGAGLGLAIAAEIARLHGGSVQLLASDQGATFAVRLPLAGGIA
jgi:two-component system heavy metal sensor histidine kinase CusS